METKPAPLPDQQHPPQQEGYPPQDQPPAYPPQQVGYQPHDEPPAYPPQQNQPALYCLAKEEERKIKAVVSSQQPKESNLIAKDGIPIRYLSLEDLRRCTGSEGGGWLSCFVINRYIQLIIDAYTSGGGIYKLGLLTSNKLHSAQTNPSALKRVARELYKEKMQQKDFIFVPVNEDKRHWCLMVINLRDQEFYYLDSMGVGKRGSEYVRLAKQLLSSMPLPGLNCENWRVKLSQDSFDIPLQNNLKDCGVYVCLYALGIIRGSGMEFEADDVEALRWQMAFELLDGEIKTENCLFHGPYFNPLSKQEGTGMTEETQDPRPEKLEDSEEMGETTEKQQSPLPDEEADPPTLEASSDEETDKEMETFLAKQVPFLKSILDNQESSKTNERLRASIILSRKEFLQVRDRELSAMLAFFGKTFSAFCEKLTLHLPWKVPPSEGGRDDLPVQTHTFANMYGIKSLDEMTSTVLLPELMTLFHMENEGIDRHTAVAKIFGTQRGHTLYHTYMVHAKQRGKENEKEPPTKKSKRKSAFQESN